MRMMPGLVMAAVCLGAPLVAEERTAALRDALAFIPAEVVAELSQPEIRFGDIPAGSAAVVALPATASAVLRGPDGGVLRAMPASWGEAYMPEGGADWPAQLGFAAAEIESVLEVAAPPNYLRVIQVSAGVAAGVSAALTANGYATEVLAGQEVYARGAEDYGIDLEARSMTDPFGNRIGAASRVAVAGDTLVQSAARPTLEAMLSDLPALATREDVAGLLGALDGLDLGAARLVRAWVFPDGDLLSAAPVPRGWGAAMIGDLSDGVTETAVLALVLPTMPLAEEAAAHVSQAWATTSSQMVDKTWADVVGAPAAAIAVQDGVPVLLVVVQVETASAQMFSVNRAADRLMQGLYMRDLVFLPAP